MKLPRTDPPRACGLTTEDVVWMFERMGIATGIDLDALIPVAADAAMWPGAMAGGRVRDALQARSAACVTATKRVEPFA